MSKAATSKSPKKTRVRAGDILLIPVTRDAFAIAKVYFVSKVFKRMMILGINIDKTVDATWKPGTLPTSFPTIAYALTTAIDKPEDSMFRTGGPWKLVGHDPTPIPKEVTHRQVAGRIYEYDEDIGPFTPAHVGHIFTQAFGGPLATEIRIQKAMGLPLTPRPTSEEIAKAKRAARQAEVERPAALDEERFWKLIEDAWTAAPAIANKRPAVAREVSQADAEAVSVALGAKVVPALRKALTRLSREELIGFDRVLERKLYDLDRQEVQAVTDGSDDGFLYARGFIVGVGQAYYDAVNADPSKALTDLEEEGITYLPDEVFEERFDDSIPRSGISRESCSNRDGWHKRSSRDGA
jgi:hypothetical protein